MSGIFIEPSETVAIKIYVGKNKSDMRLLASHDVDVLKNDKDFETTSLKEYEIVLKRPSYRDEVSILKSGIQGDASALQFNFAEVSYNRLVNLLKSWTFVDDQDVPIPSTKENIDKLHPAIARSIIDALDTLM